MKNNRLLIILCTILVFFIGIICFLIIDIKNKETFKKIDFDKNTLVEIPDNIVYENSILNIVEGYSIYISPSPKNIENNYLKIDFISLDTNDIWIKVRLLDEKDNIIGETGLVKAGEYLEKVKLTRNVEVGDKITYKIMGYEIDSYLSAGSVSLNTRIGE